MAKHEGWKPEDVAVARDLLIGQRFALGYPVYVSMAGTLNRIEKTSPAPKPDSIGAFRRDLLRGVPEGRRANRIMPMFEGEAAVDPGFSPVSAASHMNANQPGWDKPWVDTIGGAL